MITKQVVIDQIEITRAELRVRFNMELVEAGVVLRSEYLRAAVPLESDVVLEIANVNNWLVEQQPAWPAIAETAIAEITEHFDVFRARRQAVSNV